MHPIIAKAYRQLIMARGAPDYREPSFPPLKKNGLKKIYQKEL